MSCAAMCDDRYGRAHAKLGATLLAAGDDEDALRHLVRAASLPGAGGDVFFDLARAMARAGDSAGARAALDRARELGAGALDGAPIPPELEPIVASGS